MYQFIIYGVIAVTFAACPSNGELLLRAEANLLSEDRIIFPSEGNHDVGKAGGGSAIMGDNFIYIGGVDIEDSTGNHSSSCDVLTFGQGDSKHAHSFFGKCLDIPRAGIATAVLNDDTILVFGGSTGVSAHTDTVDVLTLEKQPSGELALHLTPEVGKTIKSRTDMQAVSTKNAAYVVGGFHDWGFPMSIDCFYLTSSRQVMQKKIHYQNSRWMHALVATDEKIFIAGGLSYILESDLVEVYSESKYYFTGGFLPPMHLSAPRWCLTGTGNRNLLMFAGGMYEKYHDVDGKIDFDSDKNWKCIDKYCFSSHVDIYNLKDETWSIESLSEARAFLGSSSDERYFVFAGGLIEYEKTVSSKFDVYDSVTGLWEVYEMPVARHSAEVGIVNSRVFIAGGVLSGEAHHISLTTSRIDIFDLKTKQWLDNDYLNFDAVSNVEAIE